MSKLNEILLKQKRITQERYDAIKGKADKVKLAKDKCKDKDLSKLTKAELIVIITELTT